MAESGRCDIVWRSGLGRSGLVKDVKQEVLQYLKQLYENNAPEFIYYKTLLRICTNLSHSSTAASLKTSTKSPDAIRMLKRKSELTASRT